jgi:signal transduction histidine kinase
VEDIPDDVARLLREIQYKTDIVAMLGHEVSTPVSVLMNDLEILEDAVGDRLHEDGHLALRRAMDAARHLRALLMQILALATVEADSVHATPEVITLEPFLTQMMTTIPRGDEVHVQVSDPALAIEFDPFHLSLIVTNLVTNAFKYGEPPVALEACDSTGRTRIVVSDGSAGIPESQLARLFERFRPGPAELVDGRRGNGFGLYLCRQLAEANNAELEYYRPTATSRSCFNLSLKQPTH